MRLQIKRRTSTDRTQRDYFIEERADKLMLQLYIVLKNFRSNHLYHFTVNIIRCYVFEFRIPVFSISFFLSIEQIYIPFFLYWRGIMVINFSRTFVTNHLAVLPQRQTKRRNTFKGWIKARYLKAFVSFNYCSKC